MIINFSNITYSLFNYTYESIIIQKKKQKRILKTKGNKPRLLGSYLGLAVSLNCENLSPIHPLHCSKCQTLYLISTLTMYTKLMSYQTSTSQKPNKEPKEISYWISFVSILLVLKVKVSNPVIAIIAKNPSPVG